MKRPKGKLLALVVLVGAIGVAAATGAFTVVQADRTAEVNVAGDSSALLGLTPENSYATTNGGQLEINIDNVNQNAITDFGPDVFTITNNGESATEVYIEVTDDADVNDGSAVFYVNESELSSPSANDLSSATASGSLGARFNADTRYAVSTNSQDQVIAVELSPGQSVNVGLLVDLDGQNLSDNDEVISEITIVAEEDASASVDAVESAS